MKTRTLTVTVAANRDTVFAFLSRIENLALWGKEAFSIVWREGGHWKARTPAGESYVALSGDARTGVIDLFVGEQLDEMALNPIRVVARPHGAAVIATLFEVAGEAEELFERTYNAWLADFRELARRFGGGDLSASTRERAAFFPGIVSADFFGTWDFYCAHLGFKTVAECDYYVQLAHPSGAQIAVLRHELDGTVPELVSATDGRGIWLNLDVPDADAEHARLGAAGLLIVAPPEDKPWGERMFIVRDPNGVLIALAHRLPEPAPLARYPAAS
jgi:uncharacterized glyoxalase superfamily protein PhnB